MAFLNFKQIRAIDPDLAQVQDNVKEVMTPFITNAFLDGLLIEKVTLLSAAPTQIIHTLGRTLRGWVIVDRDAVASVYRTNPTVRPDQILELTTSANTVVSLYVF